jgi:hypothetical protein
MPARKATGQFSRIAYNNASMSANASVHFRNAENRQSDYEHAITQSMAIYVGRCIAEMYVKTSTKNLGQWCY